MEQLQPYKNVNYNPLTSLEHNRSLLKYLIYALENDRSLYVENSELLSLKSELKEIEGKIDISKVPGVGASVNIKLPY